MLEVEIKFRVENQNQLAQTIEQLGAERQPTIRQVDAYFAHPSRDFAQTDEALRLRRVGETNVVTYKGPKLDATTKTRREIELPLAGGGRSFEQWSEMLTALGFKEVLQVAKSRTPFQVTVDSRELEIVLDEIDGLGWFAEIETMADEHNLDMAREAVLQLAKQLELSKPERRSYLELLLENN